MKRIIFRIFLIICLILSTVVLILKRLDLAYPADFSVCNNYSATIYDREGRMLHSYLTSDGKRRLQTRIMPNTYRELLLNYEDRRFYSHYGIDPQAIMRALWQNLRGQQTISGASTLTMQTARLIYHTSHNLQGKIRQSLRALQLEYYLNKDAILSCYTNLAPMGGNLEGLGAGAWHYFGKKPEALSLSEMAWLVALPQAPQRQNNPKNALGARNRILESAYNNGIITREAYNNALREPLHLGRHSFPQYAPHYAALALKNQTTQTTLNFDLQTRLESTLSAALPYRPPRSNLAALILANETGEKIAYVGSAAYHSKTRLGANNMLTAIRSPGSTLKPYITLYAIDRYRLHPKTFIDDTPIVGGYNPDNYDKQYLGRITLAEALRKSRNVPAVRLLSRIGPDVLTSWLEENGLPLLSLNHSAPNLSLALGGVGLRAEDLANIYRKLANCAYHPEQPTPLASHRACLQTTQILQQIGDKEGSLHYGAEPVAVKTGTAYGWRDLWVVAYTREYTILLWAGRADGGYSEQRASADALLPLMRQIIALLPNPPRHYTPPQANWITNQDTVPPVSTNTLRILSPIDHTVIENRGQSLTLQTIGGNPPYLWLINRQLLQQSQSAQTLWQPTGDGDYDIDVSDSSGAHHHIHIRLQTAPERIQNTVRLQSEPIP
ncbi:MAG: penicillin-binding protein 1C [Cardiobacteriaceae bacterium]|nr:penicillin-binding protein 1C [Cardiobacteriaceae bacterium]